MVEVEEGGVILDVIVIGAGIMGSCVAYELSKRSSTGKKCVVLLLEQLDFLHNGGSSHGESRTFRLTYPEPYYPPLVQEASVLWDQAQSEIGYRVLYSTTSQLDMAPSNDASLQAVLDSCRSNSIPFRILNPVQLSQEFSGSVSIPEGWIGVVTQGSAVIKPTKAVSMFQSLALLHGALLKDNMRVSSIHRCSTTNLLVVSTASGHSFQCRKCVVTPGPWIQKLLKEVTHHELTVPIQPLETTICYWKIKPGHEKDYTIQAGFPTFAGYGNPYVYGTPSLEYPGLIKIAVHGGEYCDPDKRTWGPSLARPDLMDYLRSWIQERFAGQVDHNGPVLTESCMYSMTPDEDYVIDFLGGQEFGNDVIIAGGFSGHGFKMGPVVGRIVADMVLSASDSHASGSVAAGLEFFKLDRFHNNPKGNCKAFAQQVGLNNSHPH